MKYLIPIPHRDTIPPYEDREVLCRMLDDIFGGLYNEAAGLNFLNDPLRCPSVFLDALVEVKTAIRPPTTRRHQNELKHITRKTANLRNRCGKPSRTLLTERQADMRLYMTTMPLGTACGRAMIPI
ncbi:MAG: hypothetical protein LBP19_05370 [Treponema sp.]|jgi:hypothetical protein|nr:hypothetical protein [Treponema sp.]